MTTLLHNRAAQTHRPIRFTPLRRNLVSVCDHGLGLCYAVLQLRGRRARSIGVCGVGEIDDSDDTGVATAEEGGVDVEALGDECIDGWYVWHAGEAGVVDRLGVGSENLEVWSQLNSFLLVISRQATRRLFVHSVALLS